MKTYIRRTKFHAIKGFLLCYGYGAFLLASRGIFTLEDLTYYYFCFSALFLFILGFFALQNYFNVRNDFNTFKKTNILYVKESILMDAISDYRNQELLAIPLGIFGMLFAPTFPVLPLLITTRTYISDRKHGKKKCKVMTLYSILSLDINKLQKELRTEGFQVVIEK